MTARPSSRSITRSVLALVGLAASACAAPADADLAFAGAHPITVVTDPDALAFLEANGFAFAERFAPAAFTAGDGGPDTRGDALLARAGRYRSLVAALHDDTLAAAADYLRYGAPFGAAVLPPAGSAQLTARETDHNGATSAGLGGRLQVVNPHWLESSSLHFELVAVTNRFDRRAVVAPCGETRLVYRAAYQGLREASRLPLTIALDFPQLGDCAAIAERWLVPDGTATPSGAALGALLAAGPLAALPADYRAADLNALTDLWSRFVKERDGVGRQHRNTLQSFVPTGDALALAPLEATPDVTSIVGGPSYQIDAAHPDGHWVDVPASAERKQQLLAWITGARPRLDGGAVPPLPAELAATRSETVTAMTLTRAANRPFSRVFMDDLRGFEAATGIATDADATALLRRLDLMTCGGCHATGSILGFHAPGEERDYDVYRHWERASQDPRFFTDRDQAGWEDQGGVERPDPSAEQVELHGRPSAGPRGFPRPPMIARIVANRLATGISPHLRDERDRRDADLVAFHDSDGQLGVAMPDPEHGGFLLGAYGSPCALGHAGACRTGLQCAAVDGTEVGQCIGLYGGDLARRSVGDPIEVHHYALGNGVTWATSHPYLDQGPVVDPPHFSCFSGGRTPRSAGFPLGGICAPIDAGTDPTARIRVRFSHNALAAATCRTSILSPSGLKAGPVVGLGDEAYLAQSGVVTTRENLSAAEQAAIADDAARGAPRRVRKVICGAAPFSGDSNDEVGVADVWGWMSTAAMIWSVTSPGFQIACDEDNPCRPEYVCMRSIPKADPAARDPREGTCMPGYVMNQLEIDAHKVPDAPRLCLAAGAEPASVVDCGR